MASEVLPGLGDVVKTVADLATYEARVAEGKVTDGVLYLILAERQVYFNGELWSKAPEEGGGGGSVNTDELEEVAAGAFNDLNARIDAQDDEIASCMPRDEFNRRTEEVEDKIICNEELIAGAFNDLNARIDAQDDEIASCMPRDEFNRRTEEVEDKIICNEELIAGAFNDLNARIDAQDDEIASCMPRDEFNRRTEEVEDKIICNEELIAHALADLNKGLQECKELLMRIEKT